MSIGQSREVKFLNELNKLHLLRKKHFREKRRISGMQIDNDLDRKRGNC